MTQNEPSVLALSRAARLEQQAGAPELRDQFDSGQACFERRQALLAEARQLRADAGQDYRLIEQAQEHNYQTAARALRGRA